jgi:hypothetical protein
VFIRILRGQAHDGAATLAAVNRCPVVHTMKDGDNGEAGFVLRPTIS